jgi:hypothetical protein
VTQCCFCGSAMGLLAIRMCCCATCHFAAVVVTLSVPFSVPVVQLIWGLNLQSHGCPRIILSFPRFVTKNSTHCSFCPSVMYNWTEWVISPALFGVLSVLWTGHGTESLIDPSRSRTTIW